MILLTCALLLSPPPDTMKTSSPSPIGTNEFGWRWAETAGFAGHRFGEPFRPIDEPADTVRRRGRAIQVSNGYATRLKIHQIGSFVMLPLVAGEFVIGQSLINNADRPSGLRSAHRAVAYGIYGVFGVNTITGALNWWETRHDPVGRTRRTVHALMLLAADAGFVLTASAAGGARRDLDRARTHRNLAEASISLSVLGSVMMWLWKN